MLPSRKRTAALAAILLGAFGAGTAVVATSGGPSHPAHPPKQALAAPDPSPPPPLRALASYARRPQSSRQPQIAPRRARAHRFATTASPVNGETFTATTGTWTGNPTSYAYQWLDCDTAGANCVNIDSANGSSYTLVSSDIGHTIRVAVTATNAFGFATQNSAQTGIVAASAAPSPQNTVAPVVTGTATQGQVLTTTKGTWSGSPSSFAYQWQDCDAEPACTDIPGASGTFSGATATYTLAATQTSHTVRAVVTATNASGDGSAFSNLTASVLGSGGTGGTWNGSAEVGAASTACNKYVSTAGSDAHDGTASDSGHAWLTIDHLIAALPAGQTGCFETGSYGSSPTDQAVLLTANVTITAAPGAVATIQGRLVVGYQSTGTTVSYLNFNENYPGDSAFQPDANCAGTTYAVSSLEMDGNNDSLLHNNIYQTNVPVDDRTNGVGFAWNPNPSTNQSTGMTVAYNRVFNFGNSCGHGHGFYIKAVGNSNFYNNWFWGNPAGGAGVQLYAGPGGGISYPAPHDDNLYANVFNNMDLGAILFNEQPQYLNLVLNHNIFSTITVRGGFQANSGTNSTIQFVNNIGTSVTGGWPCGPGACSGVTATGNITSDPQFADGSFATSHDYRLSSGSPAASWGMWDGDLGGSVSAIVGNTAVGPSAAGQDADFKRANCFAASATGTTSRVTAYLSPTGVAGSQKIQAAVYSNSGGPSSLLAQSSELTFTSTSAAGWYDLPLQAPLSVVSGSTYCLGLLTGATTQIAKAAITTGGTLYYNSDTYVGGPSDPFGSSSTGAQTMSIFMVVS